MKLLLVTLLLCAPLIGAAADHDPFDFKGVKLGSSALVAEFLRRQNEQLRKKASDL